MIEKIKKVKLVFENCEVAKISGKDIHLLELNGLAVKGVRCEPNKFIVKLKCKHCYMLLKGSADKRYNSFGKKSDMTLFDRIMRRADIVYVDIGYCDGSCIRIEMPWSDTQDTNKYQQISCGSDCLSVKIDLPQEEGD